MSGNPDLPSSRHKKGSPHQRPGKKHGLLCSCLFVSCLVWPALSAGLPAVDECEHKNCGDVHNISYPFWIEERQPPQCGYPAFRLSCKDNAAAPLIKISGDEYAVARIFYNNQSFVASSDDLSKSKCPIPSHNLSLDATPFSLSALDRNLSFFLRCSGGGPGHQLDCPAGGEGFPYVVGNQSSSDREELARICRWSVSWPYLGDGGAEGIADYAVLLRRGFLLNWNAVVNCSVCTGTGGRCRYDLLRESFSCACSDQWHAISCNGSSLPPNTNPNPSGINKRRKMATGLAAGVGGLLLAGVLSFLMCRRRRMGARTGPSSTRALFRTTSSQKDLRFKFSNHAVSAGNDVSDVPLLDFKSVKAATSNFSDENKLGEGGFGPVYKVIMSLLFDIFLLLTIMYHRSLSPAHEE